MNDGKTRLMAQNYRTAFEDSDEEIGEVIEEFLMMYQARITVIYEELRQCFCEEGMKKYCRKNVEERE